MLVCISAANRISLLTADRELLLHEIERGVVGFAVDHVRLLLQIILFHCSELEVFGSLIRVFALIAVKNHRVRDHCLDYINVCILAQQYGCLVRADAVLRIMREQLLRGNSGLKLLVKPTHVVFGGELPGVDIVAGLFSLLRRRLFSSSPLLVGLRSQLGGREVRMFFCNVTWMHRVAAIFTQMLTLTYPCRTLKNGGNFLRDCVDMEVIELIFVCHRHRRLIALIRWLAYN